MFGKYKRRLLCLIALLAYSAGSLFAPVSAGTDALSGFDVLLEKREEATNKSIVQSAKKTLISDFTDIKQNDWFYSYLDYLVSENLIKGATETEFKPSGNFSYAECSTVITRYLGLEKEAAEYKKHLEKEYGIKETLWYSGYFQVMHRLGLFDGYGLFETDGEWICSIDSSLSNSPISRYRFAESISKSFELDSSLKAKNVFSEIGGSGREFIIGGGYDVDVLEEYEEYIADFEEIPEESRKDILKAYYNGIFMGDENGLFNPNNNLTRAEMAKVLATICNYSLRERLIDDEYAPNIPEDQFITDEMGNKAIKFDFWNELLRSEAEFLHYENGIIEYSSSASAPEGYAIDAYLYTKSDNGLYKLCAESTLHEFSGGEIRFETDNARLLLVLRNVTENASVDGALNINIIDGQISDISPLIREM